MHQIVQTFTEDVLRGFNHIELSRKSLHPAAPDGGIGVQAQAACHACMLLINSKEAGFRPLDATLLQAQSGPVRPSQASVLGTSPAPPASETLLPYRPTTARHTKPGCLGT